MLKKISCIVILIVSIHSSSWSDQEYVDGYLFNDFEITQWNGMSAPSVSPSNTSRIYYDSILDYTLLSENGGAYSRLMTSSSVSTTALLLDQTTPQEIINGIPLYEEGHPAFTLDHQIVDKEYVDQAVTAINVHYYMLDTASGVSDYKNTQLEIPSEVEANDPHTVTANDQYLRGWISPSGGSPTTLVAGIYNLYFEGKVDQTTGYKRIKIYWKLVEYKADTSEVVIATSEDSDELTTSQSDYNVHCAVTDDYSVTAGSRIVGKLYADLSGSGNNPTVTIYYLGDINSRWEVPSSTEVLDGLYFKLDQSTPQTIESTVTVEGATPKLILTTDSAQWNPYLLGNGTNIEIYPFEFTGVTYLAGSPLIVSADNDSTTIKLGGTANGSAFTGTIIGATGDSFARNGRDIILYGGHALNNGAFPNANGGNIYLYGGTGYNGGVNGNILAYADNLYTKWGAAGDCGISYNGTNMVCDPKLVGSGYLSVLGSIYAQGLVDSQTSGTNTIFGVENVTTKGMQYNCTTNQIQIFYPGPSTPFSVDLDDGNIGMSTSTATTTHYGDFLMNSTKQMRFRDTALYISSINDGHMDLTADAAVDINAPQLLINGYAADAADSWAILDVHHTGNTGVHIYCTSGGTGTAGLLLNYGGDACIQGRDNVDGNGPLYLNKYGGAIVAGDAVYLTQTDGAEKVDSDADGYTDIYGGISVRIHTLLNLTPINSDPGTLTDGDIWYRGDVDEFRCRANGATYKLILTPV